MTKENSEITAKSPFKYVCDILLERDASGGVLRLMPQSRYANPKRLPLHTFGAGPFCRFRIPPSFPVEGVYALLVDGSIRYIGECLDLSARFNMGYGLISPRNCFLQGQPTNCRINHHVLEAVESGKRVELWFFATRNREAVESHLIAQFSPPWNKQGRL